MSGAQILIASLPECPFHGRMVKLLQHATTDCLLHLTWGFCAAAETELGTHPTTGQEIRVLQGPYGWYLEASAASGQAADGIRSGASENGSKGAATGTKKRAKVKAPKPQRVSLGKLPAGQVPEITLEEAVELLQWPKVRARPPRTAQCGIHAICSKNARFGEEAAFCLLTSKSP